MAQSTPPSLAIAARRSSIFCSFGCGVKSGGKETWASPMVLRTSGVIDVLTVDSCGVRGSMAGCGLEVSCASWVSAKARSSCPR
jgi:hypothetical protein